MFDIFVVLLLLLPIFSVVFFIKPNLLNSLLRKNVTRRKAIYIIIALWIIELAGLFATVPPTTARNEGAKNTMPTVQTKQKLIQQSTSSPIKSAKPSVNLNIKIAREYMVSSTVPLGFTYSPGDPSDTGQATFMGSDTNNINLQIMLTGNPILSDIYFNGTLNSEVTNNADVNGVLVKLVEIVDPSAKNWAFQAISNGADAVSSGKKTYTESDKINGREFTFYIEKDPDNSNNLLYGVPKYYCTLDIAPAQ